MLLTITPKIGNHHHYHKDHHAIREYVAQRATALPIDSPLAVAWNGLIKLPDGTLAVNDFPRAKSKVARLGFAIEGEGGGR